MSQVSTELFSTTRLDFKWGLKLKRGSVHAATFAFKVLSHNIKESRDRSEKINRELLSNSKFRESFGIEEVNHNDLVVYSSIVSAQPSELDRKMKQFQRWVKQAQLDTKQKIEKFSPTF
ncbi:hypothetical protein [Flammeovirga pacifica]|uniref:Uncharacterized protein n=1 Tax=Flammeovirga pacifica TaxID=915059 RepID=A0A1S1YYU3_FLAPC|nr:hypothetical protein [Flammeovirga pacifica]OHX66181.1 hypothetical protein NH26_07370 [Flammeovirga pacifica]